ncbi:hypothetical protein JXA85_04515 [Candidatus Woesearchaeota archaeon]|nr:hypothetical protein [Candidatus Woesearchaeota archaeon]
MVERLATKVIEPESSVMMEKEKILQLSGISLRLDTYDDIFSDFDPRPYSQRALSDDFLFEAKKVSRGKPSGTIELNFLIPSWMQNKSQEVTIKKRLRDYFSKQFERVKSERRSLLKEGSLFVVFGILLMLVATMLMFVDGQEKLLTSFLVVLLQPAGWFLSWEGLNTIVFRSRKIKPDLAFYEKMSKCTIAFTTY